jgi:L-fuculose-phosphate aldolase
MGEKGVTENDRNEINNAKESVVRAGHKLIEAGLIARTWGNVSCRVDDSHFAITPSGRDYLSLTTDDIVIVRIEDLSFTGDMKPSGEKAVHAEIYKVRPDIWFVIHTHQENASVISTLGLDEIDIDHCIEYGVGISFDVNTMYKLLGNKIICAAYGLPGTKKLRRSVGEALSKSNGKAIIMKNHGAVCFGVDDDTAFMAAMELEQASRAFIKNRFLKVKPDALSEVEAMRRFIGSYVIPHSEGASMNPEAFRYSSARNSNGFAIENAQGHVTQVDLTQHDMTQLDKSMSDIIKIHRDVYLKTPNINYITHSEAPYTLAFSEIGDTLLPFVDDFAQIIGTKVKTVSNQPQEIAHALSHSAAVFVQGHGALCTGETKGDAYAVQMILEKNAKAKICGILFDGNEPLSWIDTHLMRFVYQKKYSKQIVGGRL